MYISFYLRLLIWLAKNIQKSKKDDAKSLDLAELAQAIVDTKSTCALYKFQEVVNECLKAKQVLRRDELIATLSKLNHLVNSK